MYVTLSSRGTAPAVTRVVAVAARRTAEIRMLTRERNVLEYVRVD